MQYCYPLPADLWRPIIIPRSPLMKTIVASLFLGAALLAAPASAEVVHQTSIDHAGRTMSVTYEPRFRSNHKQTGIGPRTSAGCLWTSRVSVERIVADGSGQPIAALTRVVGEEKVAKGMHVGHCRNIEPRRMAAFGGDRDQLHGFVASAADRDRQALRTELASLDALHATNAR